MNLRRSEHSGFGANRLRGTHRSLLIVALAIILSVSVLALARREHGQPIAPSAPQVIP